MKELIRGDTWTFRVTVSDLNGIADLTGGSLELTINATEDPSDNTAAVANIVVTSFDNPATGIQNVTVPAATTTGIAVGTYYYDTEFTASGGTVTSSPRKRIKVVSDTTR